MTSLPLFPLARALFPDGVIHLRIFEVRYLDLVRRCLENDTGFGVVALTSGTEVRQPTSRETFVSSGTLVTIEEAVTPMTGLMQIRARGTQRFTLNTFEQKPGGLWTGNATLHEPDPAVSIPQDLQDCAEALGRVIADLQREGVPPEAMPVSAPYRLEDCGWVANRWAELLPLPPTQKALLLNTADPTERLDMLREVLIVKGVLP
ncbi:peptidase S16 [Pusillimonas sp. T2]|uniref:LON peptidase substrate-binding domain-containing protein n=1 Tax=Pusillimonas sp. T2 TaxID=1548123 RepID=UPI000B9D3BA6|nr:LON peptidase substrate-binding domain-containing protein [Pusillimonas sp. T2]OXR48417.1 peptidase S16 [Pusillimonas sp. T2]